MSRDLEVLGTVVSTNRVAADMKIGSSVIARVQTGGRGRLDHSWVSPPGGLYLSCVLAPPDPPTAYQFWAAVVTAGSLIELGVDVEIRWPNDILSGGMKIAGILSEHRGDRVVVGIGINVNNRMEDQPFGATSVIERTGRELDVEPLARAVAGRIHDMSPYADVMARWRALSTTEGRLVSVTTLAGVVNGTAEGVTDDGALRVRTDSGTVPVTEGECRYLD